MLAEAPYSAPLRALAAAAAASYFADGPAGLAAVVADVAKWPPPDPDAPASVAAGGVSLVASAPAAALLPAPAPPDARNPAAPLLPLATPGGAPAPHAPFFEVDVYTPFAGVLDSMWALWEATLTATPTLVLAPDPGAASTAVAGLVSLIAPLPYCADFRPYITVHDPQAAALAASTAGGAVSAPPRAADLPRLVGATSPFFARALGAAWPVVVRIGGGTGAAAGAGGSPPPPPRPPSRLRRAAAALAAVPSSALAAALPARSRARDLADGTTSGPDGMWSSFAPLARADRGLVRRLAPPPPDAPCDAAARCVSGNAAALRKLFRALTEAVLAPLTVYWQPVSPPPGDGPLPARSPPPPPPLSVSAFLDTLAASPTLHPLLLSTFGSRSAIASFYRRFLASPNWGAYIELQRASARAWEAAAWSAAVAARGVGAAPDALDEAALVDRFEGLAADLDAALNAVSSARRRSRSGDGDSSGGDAPSLPPPAPAIVDGLRRQLRAAYGSMPRDLQAALLSNPRRAAIVHALGEGVRVPGLPARRSSRSGSGASTPTGGC